MFVFSVSKQKTYGEIVDIIDWCVHNCSNHFYISPAAMMNPMAMIYQTYIKHAWPEVRTKWLARTNEIFTTFGFPSYILFEDNSDATLFKLSFDPDEICFVCKTML